MILDLRINLWYMNSADYLVSNFYFFINVLITFFIIHQV